MLGFKQRFFTFRPCLWIPLTDFKSQSLEIVFPFWAENTFFLRMSRRQSQHSGGKVCREGRGNRRSPSLFSLNGGWPPPESGRHDGRQMPPFAFPRLSGLRADCVPGVQDVSGKRGMADRMTSVRRARIVYFRRRACPSRNEALSRGRDCHFDNLTGRGSGRGGNAPMNGPPRPAVGGRAPPLRSRRGFLPSGPFPSCRRSFPGVSCPCRLTRADGSRAGSVLSRLSECFGGRRPPGRRFVKARRVSPARHVRVRAAS